MKAVCDRSVDDSPRPLLRMPSSRPQGSKAHSLSNLLQRAQAPKVQYLLPVFSPRLNVSTLVGADGDFHCMCPREEMLENNYRKTMLIRGFWARSGRSIHTPSALTHWRASLLRSLTLGCPQAEEQ